MWYQYILLFNVISSSHEISRELNVFILIKAETPCFLVSV